MTPGRCVTLLFALLGLWVALAIADSGGSGSQVAESQRLESAVESLTTNDSAQSVAQRTRIRNGSRLADPIPVPTPSGTGNAQPPSTSNGTHPVTTVKTAAEQPDADHPTSDEPAAESTVDNSADDESSHDENLSTELLSLRTKVRRVLGTYYRRPLNTAEHNPWEVMHGLIAFGVETKVLRGGPNGEPVNAAAWFSINGSCRGLQMLEIDYRGRINAKKGPYVQGHFGQFLAILAQCHVKTDYALVVDGRRFTVAELMETEKLTCQSGTELTFKLISCAHYLDSDATWKDEFGQTWSIERLIREEIQQPILRTAPCGGTHRLMGLSYALRKRQKQGKHITGEFRRAEIYLNDYHRYAFGLQNADGSFSTAWFERKADEPSVDRRLKTSGHILEWLAWSVEEPQLTDPRMIKAVDYLASILDAEPTRAWEIGPMGHALHALAIYDRRMFRKDEWSQPGSHLPPKELAQRVEASDERPSP